MQLELLRPEDPDGDAIQETAALCAATFAASEPMTSILHAQDPSQVYPALVDVFAAMVADSAATGTAAVVKDQHAVVGALLCNPMGTGYDEEWPQPLAPIHALLSQLSSEFEGLRQAQLRAGEAPPGKTLHVSVLAVASSHQRRGVAALLMDHVMLKAGPQGEGYEDMVTEATSESQGLFAKLNFQTLHEIAYGEFEHGGRRPFAGARWPSAKLMWRKF